MKKKYTKKQITEAISYWKKQLKKLDEARVRQGDNIYSDQVPFSDDYDYSKTKAQLGKEASVITVDSWKKDKLYPDEKIEKCSSIQDLKRIYDKYHKQFLLIQFLDDEILSDV